MLSGWFVALLSATYMALLFAVARFGDARADAGRSIITANVYALSLAVYCTSWTFFGSVGRATSGGLSFLTIYIGPTLMLLCVGVIVKMIRISQGAAHHLDCRLHRLALRQEPVAGRAGDGDCGDRHRALHRAAVEGRGGQPGCAVRPAGACRPSSGASIRHLLVAAVLALFTILFGTRHLDATERHEGMVAAVAFRIGGQAGGLHGRRPVRHLRHVRRFFGDLFQRPASIRNWPVAATGCFAAGTWTAMILLSGLAIIFLPRQFQIIVVENVDESHLKRAVWLFPLYLLLINIFVLPLALGGLMHFSGQGAIPIPSC
jgi:Na+/proline symporter